MTGVSGVIDSIMDFIHTGPVVTVYLFLFFGAFTRAQTTYWIGRYMGKFIMTRGRPAGGWRLRAYEAIHAPSTGEAIDTLQRRGWPIIPLSFLTVGFQSMIQFSAGLTRMTWPRYTPAMIPGALAWALIYSTIGWAVWEAALKAVAGSPLTLLIVLTLIVCLVIWRKQRGNKAIIDAISTDSEDEVRSAGLGASDRPRASDRLGATES